MLVKSQKIVVTFMAWAMLMIGILALSSSLSYEFLIAIDILGLLIIVQVMSPYVVKPRWRARMNRFLLIGIVIFSLVMLQKVLYLLSEAKRLSS